MTLMLNVALVCVIDELYGDFEDLETGEKHKGTGGDGKDDEDSSSEDGEKDKEDAGEDQRRFLQCLDFLSHVIIERHHFAYP